MSDETPYLAPRSNLLMPETFVYEGGLAKMKSPARLPLICVICNKQDSLEPSKGTLSYTNPLIFLWFILTPIAFIAAYFICRKKIYVDYSLCSSCAAHITKWSKREKLSWAIFFGAIISVAFWSDSFAYRSPIMAAALIFALFCATKRDNHLSVKKFRDGYFFVSGVPVGDLENEKI